MNQLLSASASPLLNNSNLELQVVGFQEWLLELIAETSLHYQITSSLKHLELQSLPYLSQNPELAQLAVKQQQLELKIQELLSPYRVADHPINVSLAGTQVQDLATKKLTPSKSTRVGRTRHRMTPMMQRRLQSRLASTAKVASQVQTTGAATPVFGKDLMAFVQQQLNQLLIPAVALSDYSQYLAPRQLTPVSWSLAWTTSSNQLLVTAPTPEQQLLLQTQDVQSQASSAVKWQVYQLDVSLLPLLKSINHRGRGLNGLLAQVLATIQSLIDSCTTDTGNSSQETPHTVQQDVHSIATIATSSSLDAPHQLEVAKFIVNLGVQGKAWLANESHEVLKQLVVAMPQLDINVLLQLTECFQSQYALVAQQVANSSPQVATISAELQSLIPILKDAIREQEYSYATTVQTIIGEQLFAPCVVLMQKLTQLAVQQLAILQCLDQQQVVLSYQLPSSSQNNTTSTSNSSTRLQLHLTSADLLAQYVDVDQLVQLLTASYTPRQLQQLQQELQDYQQGIVTQAASQVGAKGAVVSTDVADQDDITPAISYDYQTVLAFREHQEFVNVQQALNFARRYIATGLQLTSEDFVRYQGLTKLRQQLLTQIREQLLASLATPEQLFAQLVGRLPTATAQPTTPHQAVSLSQALDRVTTVTKTASFPTIVNNVGEQLSLLGTTTLVQLGSVGSQVTAYLYQVQSATVPALALEAPKLPGLVSFYCTPVPLLPNLISYVAPPAHTQLVAYQYAPAKNAQVYYDVSLAPMTAGIETRASLAEKPHTHAAQSSSKTIATPQASLSHTVQQIFHQVVNNPQLAADTWVWVSNIFTSITTPVLEQLTTELTDSTVTNSNQALPSAIARSLPTPASNTSIQLAVTTPCTVQQLTATTHFQLPLTYGKQTPYVAWSQFCNRKFISNTFVDLSLDTELQRAYVQQQVNTVEFAQRLLALEATTQFLQTKSQTIPSSNAPTVKKVGFGSLGAKEASKANVALPAYVTSHQHSILTQGQGTPRPLSLQQQINSLKLYVPTKHTAPTAGVVSPTQSQQDSATASSLLDKNASSTCVSNSSYRTPHGYHENLSIDSDYLPYDSANLDTKLHPSDATQSSSITASSAQRLYHSPSATPRINKCTVNQTDVYYQVRITPQVQNLYIKLLAHHDKLTHSEHEQLQHYLSEQSVLGHPNPVVMLDQFYFVDHDTWQELKRQQDKSELLYVADHPDSVDASGQVLTNAPAYLKSLYAEALEVEIARALRASAKTCAINPFFRIQADALSVLSQDQDPVLQQRRQAKLHCYQRVVGVGERVYFNNPFFLYGINCLLGTLPTLAAIAHKVGLDSEVTTRAGISQATMLSYRDVYITPVVYLMSQVHHKYAQRIYQQTGKLPSLTSIDQAVATPPTATNGSEIIASQGDSAIACSAMHDPSLDQALTQDLEQQLSQQTPGNHTAYNQTVVPFQACSFPVQFPTATDEDLVSELSGTSINVIATVSPRPSAMGCQDVDSARDTTNASDNRSQVAVLTSSSLTTTSEALTEADVSSMIIAPADAITLNVGDQTVTHQLDEVTISGAIESMVVIGDYAFDGYSSFSVLAGLSRDYLCFMMLALQVNPQVAYQRNIKNLAVNHNLKLSKLNLDFQYILACQQVLVRWSNQVAIATGYLPPRIAMYSKASCQQHHDALEQVYLTAPALQFTTTAVEQALAGLETAQGQYVETLPAESTQLKIPDPATHCYRMTVSQYQAGLAPELRAPVAVPTSFLIRKELLLATQAQWQAPHWQESQLAQLLPAQTELLAITTNAVQYPTHWTSYCLPPVTAPSTQSMVQQQAYQVRYGTAYARMVRQVARQAYQYQYEALQQAEALVSNALIELRNVLNVLTDTKAETFQALQQLAQDLEQQVTAWQQQQEVNVQVQSYFLDLEHEQEDLSSQTYTTTVPMTGATALTHGEMIAVAQQQSQPLSSTPMPFTTNSSRTLTRKAPKENITTISSTPQAHELSLEFVTKRVATDHNAPRRLEQDKFVVPSEVASRNTSQVTLVTSNSQAMNQQAIAAVVSATVASTDTQSHPQDNLAKQEAPETITKVVAPQPEAVTKQTTTKPHKSWWQFLFSKDNDSVSLANKPVTPLPDNTNTNTSKAKSGYNFDGLDMLAQKLVLTSLGSVSDASAIDCEATQVVNTTLQLAENTTHSVPVMKSTVSANTTEETLATSSKQLPVANVTTAPLSTSSTTASSPRKVTTTALRHVANTIMSASKSLLHSTSSVLAATTYQQQLGSSEASSAISYKESQQLLHKIEYLPGYHPSIDLGTKLVPSVALAQELRLAAAGLVPTPAQPLITLLGEQAKMQLEYLADTGGFLHAVTGSNSSNIMTSQEARETPIATVDAIEPVVSVAPTTDWQVLAPQVLPPLNPLQLLSRLVVKVINLDSEFHYWQQLYTEFSYGNLKAIGRVDAIHGCELTTADLQYNIDVPSLTARYHELFHNTDYAQFLSHRKALLQVAFDVEIASDEFVLICEDRIALRADWQDYIQQALLMLSTSDYQVASLYLGKSKLSHTSDLVSYSQAVVHEPSTGIASPLSSIERLQLPRLDLLASTVNLTRAVQGLAFADTSNNSSRAYLIRKQAIMDAITSKRWDLVSAKPGDFCNFFGLGLDQVVQIFPAIAYERHQSEPWFNRMDFNQKYLYQPHVFGLSAQS